MIEKERQTNEVPNDTGQYVLCKHPIKNYVCGFFFKNRPGGGPGRSQDLPHHQHEHLVPI